MENHLGREDIRAILSVMDKRFDDLITEKQSYLEYKVEETLRELSPQFKNHVVTVYEGYAGASISFSRLDATLKKDVFGQYCKVCTDHDSISVKIFRTSSILKKFEEIINFCNEHAKVGRSEFAINTVTVRGDFDPTTLL